MKSANRRKIVDIIYCIFVTVAFIAVSLRTALRLPLPQCLITDLPLSEFSFVILQIQVTIAVLPLARLEYPAS